MGDSTIQNHLDREITMVSIDELKPHPKNPNSHSKEQIKRLAQILEYQGWRYPIKVSVNTGYITSGHGRLKAARLLGLKEVPVSFQEYADDDQEYADIVSDNSIASWSELDLSAINLEIQNFSPDFDIDLLGIDGFKIDVAEKRLTDADSVPENVETRAKRGDVWILGNHRLMCGDSTSMTDVEKLMAGEKADMVFTDPPYGMKLDADFSKMGGTGLKHKNVIGDHQDFKDELITTIFQFNDAREIFIFGADYFAQLLPDRNEGSWVVWDRRSKGEDAVGITDGQFGSDFELCWSRTKHKRVLARVLRPTGYYAARTEDKACHPTRKPIALAEFFFEQWGKPSDLVVDVYGGSGSTLIACEKTNRKCFMMEIDPHYCDVIIKRWEDYTGQQAMLSDETEHIEDSVKHV